MIFLLEVKLIGTDWMPRRILEENTIHQALNSLVLDQSYYDWRVRRINPDDVRRINAKIAVQWPS